MSQNWPTKEKDLRAARVIMEEYAKERNSEALGFFEVIYDARKKEMSFCLSGWVVLLLKHFNAKYGQAKGEMIARQIFTRCILQGHTVH